MQVTIHAAKTNLSKLIEAAQAGEEVIIAKGNKPVAKLVAVEKKKFKFNALKGRVKGPIPDFFEPMSEEDLELWEGGKS
ncbi:MAG: type II toxin-antitoxin system prevent-host-death family antitoxin [Hyphomicrobiaceae bacterium]|jgi:prevent-host-death family protein|nr:type II toxin-antitoxin system prevent-host-death family antitoxin [Hyphomicrobiaceae bacterium]